MRKWIPCIIAVLWTACITVMSMANVQEINYNKFFTSYHDDYSGEELVYFTEYLEEDSALYAMDEQGKVHYVVKSSQLWKGSRFSGMLEHNGYLYALLERAAYKDGYLQMNYQILEFDKEGKPLMGTPMLEVMDSGPAGELSADETGLYFTLLPEGGMTADAYYVSNEEFLWENFKIKEKTAEEDMVYLDSYDSLMKEDELRIVDAVYEDGEFLVWDESGTGAEYFAKTEEMLNIFQYRILSISQFLKLYGAQLLPLLRTLFIGYFVLLLTSFMVRSRRHMVSVAVVVELVLAAIILIGTRQVLNYQEQIRQGEAKRFAVYYMDSFAKEIGEPTDAFFQAEDFYESEIYFRLYRLFSGAVKLLDGTRVFDDVCLVRAEDGQVLASANRNNGVPVGLLYGTKVRLVVEDLKNTGSLSSGEVEIDGQEKQAIAVPLGEAQEAAYVLLGIVTVPEAEGENQNAQTGYEEYAEYGDYAGYEEYAEYEDYAGYEEYAEYVGFGGYDAYGEDTKPKKTMSPQTQFIILAEVVFLIGSLLCLWILFRQDKEWKELAKGMRSVAGGDFNIRSKYIVSRDVTGMWNTLTEIIKKIDYMNYGKAQMLEACYRFLPTNIEKIFGKTSITEVQSGEQVQVSGTVGIITTKATAEVRLAASEKMNHFISIMEKHREEGQGILASGQSSLSGFKLLFLEKKNAALPFGISFLQEIRGSREADGLEPAVFLHYSEYIYGIAGTKKQSFPYLISEEMSELEKYADWLRQKNVKLVITESVREKEQNYGTLRYIGYLPTSAKRQQELRLYEVLDACPGMEKSRKLSTLSAFEAAMELFGKHEFYPARNRFAEVVKENPKDLIAKWYLFTCEKYLTGSKEAYYDGALRCEDRVL